MFYAVAIFIVIYLSISIVPNTFASDSKNRDYTVTGHRGAAGLAPENTLLAMQRGIEAGADFIECDIHLTKDNEVIVCHDTTIDRTTTGKGEIAALTLAEILAYDIVDEQGAVTDLKIPTLDQLLELVGGKTNLIIEIKRKGNIYDGIEDKMVEIIQKHNAQEWVVVQSFNDSALEKTHTLMPQLRLEKLFVAKMLAIPYIFDGTFTRFDAQKYHYVSSFNIYHKAASKSLVDKIHAMGKEVKIWTIKDHNTKIPDVGVDGIISDRPDMWQ
ncbi:MAG: glycerophosphodiester phosphodiesterase family protein [Rikenellaceae bacterium]